MKRFLLLITTLFLLVGCSKENEIADQDFTKNLTGSRFLNKAWYSDGNGQVFHVLEFKANNQVEYSLRLHGTVIFNTDYTKTYTYKITSPIAIEFDGQRAVITNDILTINSGKYEGIYNKPLPQ